MTMLLREGLLDGKTVVISGSVAPQVREQLLALGAAIAAPEAEGDAIGPPDPETGALVHDAGNAFADGGLTQALEQTWSAVSTVAAQRLIPAGQPGKVVLIAPRPDAGNHAVAAREALENLARTLSVEWARYAITTVAIKPGTSTTDEELATLVCFLLSRAGDYYSGCGFELGAA